MSERRQAASPDARSFLGEIREVLPKLEVATAFDVGANVGQSLRRFGPAFPKAVIHAFEPAPETFAALSARYGASPSVRLHRLALGAAEGRALITDREKDTGNQIVEDAGGQPTREIEMTTGDAFCAAAGIAEIDFLKIDTEGHDLDVLRGFARMLGERGRGAGPGRGGAQSRQPPARAAFGLHGLPRAAGLSAVRDLRPRAGVQRPAASAPLQSGLRRRGDRPGQPGRPDRQGRQNRQARQGPRMTRLSLVFAFDQRFLPGFAPLVASLRRHSPILAACDRIVITPDPAVAEDPQVRRLATRVRLITDAEIAAFGAVQRTRIPRTFRATSCPRTR